MVDTADRPRVLGARTILIVGIVLALSFLGAWLTVGKALTDATHPPGTIAGVPLLDQSLAGGELTIEAVTGSAFMTTVEATFQVESDLHKDDTIMIPSEALGAVGFANPRVVAVSRSDTDSFAIVVQGDRLQNLSLLALTLTHYLMVPAAHPELETKVGPWVAMATVRPKDVPGASAVTLPDPPSVDTGAGLVFVLDGVATDGSSTRVEYHLEGDVENVGLLPTSPEEPSMIPAIDTSSGTYSGVVVIPAVPADGVLRFPHAYRQHLLNVEIAFDVRSGDSITVVTPHGTMMATLVIDESGRFHIELEGRDVLAMLSPGSSEGVVVVDNMGNFYRPHEGSAATPASWSDPRPGRATLSFPGPIAGNASELVLTLPRYDQLIFGNWEVTVLVPAP